MNACPSAPRHQLDLRFVREGARTIVDRRHFTWPYCLSRTFHRPENPEGMVSVILQTLSGAIHAEDQLSQRFVCEAGGRVNVTTPGATSVHRAEPHQTASERVIIEAGEDSVLEYLPEPRILFPDSALRQSMDILCRPGAAVLVSDAFTSHDPTGLERPFRQFESTVTCRGDNYAPLAIDRLWLGGLDVVDLLPYRGYATVLMISDGGSSLQETITALVERASGIPGLYMAASKLPNAAGIGVRMAGVTVQSIRDGVSESQSAFRAMVQSRLGRS